MSTPAAAIQAAFGADTEPLAKGAAQAEGIIGNFGSKASALLGALGIGLGAGAVMGFFKTIIDKGGALQDLSDRLGVGTDEMQAFDYAAQQAGATSEQTTLTWDKAKKALDSLAAGEEGTARQFAMLGLHAKDFIGLNLAQSLERIAKAYAENKERAGAYDAVTDILGTKSAPRLNMVLLQLAAEGFGGLETAARDAGAVMEKEAIERFDKFGDRLEKFKRNAEVAGSWLANLVLKAADFHANVVAATLDATGVTEKFYESMNGGAVNAAAKATGVLLPALEKTTEQLKAQKELAQARKTLDEFLVKAAMEEADYAGKVSELKRQIALHAERAFAVGVTAVVQEQELLKFAQAQADLKKLERAEREKIANATRLAAEEEIKYAQLVAKQSKGLTQEEQTALELYRLQTAELRRQHEVKTILAKGVENLTEADKARLTQLFQQGEKLAEQIGEKKELLAVTKEQVVTEGKVVDALEKQKVYRLTIKQGRADKDLSDRELAEKENNLRRQVDANNQARARGEWGDPFAAMAAGELDKVRFEQNRRRRFRSDYAVMGEKAFNNYSAFDEQTLRNYIRPEDERRAQRQLDLTQSIDSRLRRLLGGD